MCVCVCVFVCVCVCVQGCTLGGRETVALPENLTFISFSFFIPENSIELSGFNLYNILGNILC